MTDELTDKVKKALAELFIEDEQEQDRCIHYLTLQKLKRYNIHKEHESPLSIPHFIFECEDSGCNGLYIECEHYKGEE